jgi:hypothetical protein
MQNEDNSLQSSPQQTVQEQSRGVVALSGKQILSLYKKSEQSGIPFDTLKEVYERGYTLDLSEQTAFDRVNSFIAGGAAMVMDKDLIEKRGLWDNIWAKRNRIKHGSGEHMRRPGEKGRPTEANMKASHTKEEYTGAEKVSSNSVDPSSRFIGTDQLTKVFKEATPGQSQTLKTIKRVVKETSEIYECNGNCTCGKEMKEDAKGYKNPTGGLTQKGRDHFNRETGSHLKAPVTTPPSKLKKGSKAANRRKSFCARMSGVEGPMKKPNGEPTRKALALRKWNC